MLGSIADTSKDGLISFAEFQAFEGLLCTPDALYKTAFQLFDTNGNGTVNYNEFCQVIKKTDLHAKIPFHLDGQFVQRYFGKVCLNFPHSTPSKVIDRIMLMEISFFPTEQRTCN